MAKKARALAVRHHKTLAPQRCRCPVCGERRWLDYTNHRTLRLLDGLTRLDLAVRRCHNAACSGHLRPYRPEAEERLALPPHEFGLDVIALIGALRYAEHRTVPEIHPLLLGRGLPLSERSVTNLLDRYDELLAVAPATTAGCRNSCPARAGSSWPSTAYNPTSATRCSG